MRLVILICFEMETKLNPNLNLVAHLVSLDIPLANADFHLLICGLVSVRSRHAALVLRQGRDIQPAGARWQREHFANRGALGRASTCPTRAARFELDMTLTIAKKRRQQNCDKNCDKKINPNFYPKKPTNLNLFEYFVSLVLDDFQLYFFTLVSILKCCVKLLNF